ncbi:RICIN domain-containing protein [Fibrobacter sp. UBA4309]|uniref:RICIN domain-containing protein n=1 Tax=Fibrobacter sp. UBA4309 TaxID=1946537 RepID=UPI0025C6CE9C|nr:RICIN domain-containing protein [Fibrobacter sp. UBA4309]
MFFKRSFLALSAIALAAVFTHAEVTYTLHKSANPSSDEQDAYKRITTVMDSAVKLYNTYSNLSKFINVYYAPGVPTAEASSNGDLRFGENRSYMVVPTAMHEMGHTMGIGTTQEYWDVCKDGVFRNDKVQAKLRELDNDPTKELHCDSQHIWPYGLNRASEVSSEKDLINHVILVETIYQQLFKVAFYKEGRIKSLGETKKCMGITSSNALELMDCSDTATFVKIFSVGDNPVTYYIQLGSRVVDIPNESTAAGIVASTYGYNGGAHQRYTFDDAGINTPNAFLLKNYKSGLYLQAVGTQVQQNRKVDRDESFIWKLEEAGSKPDTSSAGDTSVVAPDTSDTSKTDTSITRIVRIHDIQLQAAPTRTFDLKGRSVRPQPLGRNRETYRKLFSK